MKDFITYDHPNANGRTPEKGELEYGLKFTLEDGSVLNVKMGEEGWNSLTDMMMDMLADTPSYDDGSLKEGKGEE